jgi:hypothetical protein
MFHFSSPRILLSELWRIVRAQTELNLKESQLLI